MVVSSQMMMMRRRRKEWVVWRSKSELQPLLRRSCRFIPAQRWTVEDGRRHQQLWEVTAGRCQQRGKFREVKRRWRGGEEEGRTSTGSVFITPLTSDSCFLTRLPQTSQSTQRGEHALRLNIFSSLYSQKVPFRILLIHKNIYLFKYTGNMYAGILKLNLIGFKTFDLF